MSHSKKRILCLEDDSDTNDLVRLMLEPEGYEVVTAPTVKDALRLFKKDGFHLLIVNEKLPDGEGNDFCREVRKVDRLTPIIVHSAAARKADIDEAIRAGANDYLIKPHGWSKIIEVVGKLVD